MGILCATSSNYGFVQFSPSSFLHPKPLRAISFHRLPSLNLSQIGVFPSRTLKDSRAGSMVGNSQGGFLDSIDGSEVGFLETEVILRNSLSNVRAEIDSSGWESRINRSSKWVMLGIFSAIVIGKHDAESLWAPIGAVLNTMIAMALKRLLNQQRPVSALRADPGMPSSHSQSIFYITVYAVLLLANWLGINALCITLATLTLGCSSYLSWLRVSQGFHTINQILVGAVVGSMFGALWFGLWHAFAQTAYEQYLWVRMFVIVGSILLSLGFLVYVVRHWVARERETSG